MLIVIVIRDMSNEVQGEEFNVSTENPGKDEISVSAGISKRNKNNFILKLIFSVALRFVEEYKDNDNPVYVMIMLDRFGSMGKTTGFASAKNASIDLSNRLQYNYEHNSLNYMLGLYTFSTTVEEEKNLKEIL